MTREKLTGLLSATAFVALAVVIPTAQAQMMAPPPAAIMAPMQGSPGEVEFYSDSPKVEPGDNPANWSARQNVVDSERYERLVHTNPTFRAARIHKECGTFQNPAAFQQCAASFDQ